LPRLGGRHVIIDKGQLKQNPPKGGIFSMKQKNNFILVIVTLL